MAGRVFISQREVPACHTVLVLVVMVLKETGIHASAYTTVEFGRFI